MSSQQQLELFKEEDQQQDTGTEALEKINKGYQGVLITINKGSQSRQVSGEDKEDVLNLSGASREAVSISKRLFDRRMVKRIPALRKVREIFSKIESLKTDKRYTLPHPEPGVRLLRRGGPHLDTMEKFVQRFESLRAELREAAEDLYRDWDYVKEVAQQELGRFYDPKDYAFDPRQAMSASLRFYEVDVPSYLQHNEKLYAREAARVRAELELVKRMKESEMSEELFQFVERLAERLQPRKLLDDTHEVIRIESIEGRPDVVRVVYQPAGTSAEAKREEAEVPRSQLASRVKTDRRPKTFRDSTVVALQESLEHAEEMLQELSLGGGKFREALNRLRSVVGSVDPKALGAMLRSSDAERERVREQLEQVSETILESVVDKPRRAVLRNRRAKIRKEV